MCALHLLERVTIQHYHPWERGEDFRALNPLKKIPVLVREDGSPLYDSPVICEYLHTLRAPNTPTLFPKEHYYEILTLQALCDGMLDSGVSVRYETHFRPKHLQSMDWIHRQMKALESGGEFLTTMIKGKKGILSLEGGKLHFGHVCVLTTVSYLSVRYADMMAQDSWEALMTWKEALLKDHPHFIDHLPRDYLPLPEGLEGIVQ